LAVASAKQHDRQFVVNLPVATRECGVMMASAIARIDPRVRRTRELLIDAFGTLLGTRGFTALTVQDVASQAGVNRATFYAHYANKYELFDQWARARFRADLERHLPSAQEFTLSQLPLLVRAVLERIVELDGRCVGHAVAADLSIEPVSLEFARVAAGHALVEDEVRRYVEAWRSALRPGASAASAHTTALVVSAGIVSTGFAWSRSADRAPIEQMVREICELTARTLR
jgi:AcrR family transcriptional regulator